MGERSKSGICVACPMQREAEILRRELEPACEVLATGLGIRRSLPLLLRRFREDPPDLLVFTGSASQLDLSLEMGDIVLPEAWCLEDGPCFDCHGPTLSLLRSAGFETCSKGLSTSHPVMKAAQRRELFERSGARIYDSVTAAVVRIAVTSRISCVTPKIVAGTVNSGLMTFWNQLDRNLLPLADYLRSLAEALEARNTPGGGTGVEP